MFHPFGGEVIKTNNDDPSGGNKANEMNESRESGETPVCSELGLATGSRASLHFELC